MAGSLKMNFYTPLGYFNLSHINMTSMGLKGYVRLMQWNDRMRSLVASKYAKPVSPEFGELFSHGSQPCLERRSNGLPLAIAGKQQRNGKAGRG